MPRGIKTRFDESEIRAFLNDPLGPVAHLIQELGGRAALIARTKVRKRTVGSPGKSGKPGNSVPPGGTLASIEAFLVATGADTPMSGISAAGAAIFLEKGTRPHIIESHGPWSLSNYATGYFGPLVKHPGARPWPFLVESLWALQGQV
jgi:hypothetical protein